MSFSLGFWLRNLPDFFHTDSLKCLNCGFFKWFSKTSSIRNMNRTGTPLSPCWTLVLKSISLLYLPTFTCTLQSLCILFTAFTSSFGVTYLRRILNSSSWLTVSHALSRSINITNVSSLCCLRIPRADIRMRIACWHPTVANCSFALSLSRTVRSLVGTIELMIFAVSSFRHIPHQLSRSFVQDSNGHCVPFVAVVFIM
jgi:hypothetical protein